MTNPKTEKVRRYQAARVRLPCIMLTTVDQSNIAICLMPHGTVSMGIKCAVAHLIERYAGGGDAESQPEPGEHTGVKLQSVFLPPHYADAWRIVSHDCGGGPKALRQALHEYATHITKAYQKA
jgi:hypothetical protein